MHVELLPDAHRVLHFHSYLHTERAFDWIMLRGTGVRTLSSDKMSIKVRAHPGLCFVRQLYVPPSPVQLNSCVLLSLSGDVYFQCVVSPCLHGPQSAWFSARDGMEMGAFLRISGPPAGAEGYHGRRTFPPQPFHCRAAPPPPPQCLPPP